MHHHRHRPLARSTEHHLASAIPVAEAATAHGLERWLDRTAAVMAEHRISPLQERMTGPLDGRRELLALRRRVLARHGLDADSPSAFVGTRASARNGEVGWQLWGFAPRAGTTPSLSTVTEPGGICGRLLVDEELRLLWLTDIDGRPGPTATGGGVTAQAQRMLERALTALQRQRFELADVVRTWIFLRRILDWYGELNRVRTALFAEHGLTGESGTPPFPASTGIQGARSDEECTMELLAARRRRGATPTEQVAGSERQQSPFAYGSAFTRAMSLRWQQAETIFVSGTASIGPDGRSRHRDEPEAQLLETLLAVAALVEPRGCRLDDVAAGWIYLKNDRAAAAYDRLQRTLQLPALPLVPMRADVCRPELLVEIEAIVQAPGGTGDADTPTPRSER